MKRSACYFGLHYDFHANADDKTIGTRCSEQDLLPMLKVMGPDFAQTDCKGVHGMTSWFSKVPNATVSPGVVKDALGQWRAVTRKLGMPLNCHYSGVWDEAAAAKHRNWRALDKDGNVQGAGSEAGQSRSTGKYMCRLGPYADELLIPQFMELLDRYDVDGFWVDGDLWCVEPCYCPRCRKAFAERTGISDPPTDPAAPEWAEWLRFTREAYYAYVERYCLAVHTKKPGALVCSNWLQSFRNPGEPLAPTDWISGDNTGGLDDCRCEARFISTRGKPWDIMLWNFYSARGTETPDSPWNAKPVQMLQQEAAVILAMGGGVQIYESPAGLRSGQLVPWRQKRMRAVGRYIKARRAVCQDTETIPQVAVLHSEAHLYSKGGRNLFFDVDTQPVRGAVYSLLEAHYGVDILDEWALTRRIREFPVVVAPEQERMSNELVALLERYVKQGGRLLVTGAASFDRFGAKFLGAASMATEKNATYHVPAADGSVPLYSAEWRLLDISSAKAIGRLGRTPLLDEQLLCNPAAVVNEVGRGVVGYIPCNIFRDFARNRYPLTRVFIACVMRAVAGKQEIEVAAPTCVDVTLRRRDGVSYVHLINRASGIPNETSNVAVDEIPAVGPVIVRMRLPRKPASVSLTLERGQIGKSVRAVGSGATLQVTVPSVRIHAALAVKA